MRSARPTRRVAGGTLDEVRHPVLDGADIDDRAPDPGDDDPRFRRRR